MQLRERLARLEASVTDGRERWVRVFQDEGQTLEQAYAAHEAEHGPINGANVILRVVEQPNMPFRPVPNERTCPLLSDSTYYRDITDIGAIKPMIGN